MSARPTPEPGGPESFEWLGVEVRARRLAANLSIAEVARRAEVSAPFISQLEAGRTSVSIPTLYRVASALGCTANALLGVHDARPHLVRAGAGPRLPATSGERTQNARVLTSPGDGVLLEAYHYVIDRGDDEQEWFEHGGEDFVYCVRGSIAIEFGDGTRSELRAGDSLHHGGVVPHRWLLLGDEPAEVLVVVGAVPRTMFTRT